MSRSERLLALIQVLRRHRRPVSGRRLAEELEVSLRTIYRDLATLARQGAPIEGEAGVGFLLRPGFLLPPLMFRDEEIEALVLGSRWVAQQSDPALAAAAQDVVAKILTVLPERLKEKVEHSGLYPVPAEARAHDAVDGKLLREAIRRERKLRLLYRDGQGRKTRRVVWPLALAFFERVRVLVAWCESRRGYRHFRTDRILAAELTADPLPRPRRLLLRDWRSRENLPDAEL